MAHANNLSVVDTGDGSVLSSFSSGGDINVLNFFHFSAVQIPGAFGDADCDEDIDLGDHTSLTECLAGAAVTPPMMIPDCLNAFDSDSDGDVDLQDAAAFWSVFGNP